MFDGAPPVADNLILLAIHSKLEGATSSRYEASLLMVPPLDLVFFLTFRRDGAPSMPLPIEVLDPRNPTPRNTEGNIPNLCRRPAYSKER
jgi:hypothetical protein